MTFKGTRDSENTGVWVGNKKYAALGLNASRWITTHGFSLNVCPDMNAFKVRIIELIALPLTRYNFRKNCNSMSNKLNITYHRIRINFIP